MGEQALDTLLWLQLALEAFWHQLAPFKAPTLQHALLLFGEVQTATINSAVVVGSALAAMLLYVCGYALQPAYAVRFPAQHDMMRAKLADVAPFAALFAATPLGFALLLWCGVMRVPFWRFLLALAAGLGAKIFY